MIQRIQSIYLLLVTVLMSLMIFMPFADIALQDGMVAIFHSFAIHKYITLEHKEIVMHTLPVLFMICIIGLISFVNIFLFGKRIVQMRLCILNVLLLTGLMIMIFYYFFAVKRVIPIRDQDLKLAIIFPVMGIILTLLADRSIHNDEILVRSYDRLR
jgi:hypothetical protein